MGIFFVVWRGFALLDINAHISYTEVMTRFLCLKYSIWKTKDFPCGVECSIYQDTGMCFFYRTAQSTRKSWINKKKEKLQSHVVKSKMSTLSVVMAHGSRRNVRRSLYWRVALMFTHEQKDKMASSQDAIPQHETNGCGVAWLLDCCRK